MENLNAEIRGALNKTTKHTSESVFNIIAAVSTEYLGLEDRIKRETETSLNPRLTEEEQSNAEARLKIAQTQLDRLDAAIPQLQKLKRELDTFARDTQQKKRRKALEKNLADVVHDMEGFEPTMMKFAQAMNTARSLQEEINIFNHRPVKGVPINPKDEMISMYPFLQAPIPEAVLNGTRLVDLKGNLLYSPADRKVSKRPIFQHTTSPVDPLETEKQNLQYATEQRIGTEQRLMGWQRLAQSQGVTIEKVASWQSVGPVELDRMRAIAKGDDVDKAQAALDAAQEAVSPPSSTQN